MKHHFRQVDRKRRGQSFVELSLVVLILALLLAGVTEFGFMLNNYLHVLDGAREAARYSSSAQAFTFEGVPPVYTELPAFYYVTALVAAQTMTPIVLNPANNDDIIVSVFSLVEVPDGGGSPTLARFPSSTGWSLCAHYADFVSYLNGLDPPREVPEAVAGPGWGGCTPRQSAVESSDIGERAGLAGGAPPTGALLVEIYYGYPQLLKLPIFNNSIYSAVPDPVPLYVYSVMPNSAAEPTPTP